MVRTRFALILYFRMVAHKAACHTLSSAFLKSMNETPRSVQIVADLNDLRPEIMYLMNVANKDFISACATASLITVSIVRKTIFLSIKNNQDRNSTVEQHRRWSD